MYNKADSDLLVRKAYFISAGGLRLSEKWDSKKVEGIVSYPIGFRSRYPALNDRDYHYHATTMLRKGQTIDFFVSLDDKQDDEMVKEAIENETVGTVHLNIYRLGEKEFRPENVTLVLNQA